MKKAWLDQDDTPEVAVYVVWSVQAGARERHVPAAARLMADRRALHFWDGGQLAGRAFQPIVGSPVPAWDVWMLFERGARWQGKAPPRPAWWEHQLRSMPRDRFLDPQRFARRARELLSTKAALLRAVGRGSHRSGAARR